MVSPCPFAAAMTAPTRAPAESYESVPMRSAPKRTTGAATG